MGRSDHVSEAAVSSGYEAPEPLQAWVPTTESPAGRVVSAPLERRFRAAMVAFGPAVLLAGILYHPYIADLTDKAAVAAALASGTTRWGLAHLVIGIGSGLIVLAFFAVRAYLRESGEERWSVLSLPFIVLGSVLFAFLPAMEIAMLGAAGAGADVRAVLIAMNPWFVPILLGGALVFALGVVAMVVAIARSGVLGPGLTWLVGAALIVMAGARFVPTGAAIYLTGAAGIGALWPLAWAMSKPVAGQNP